MEKFNNAEKIENKSKHYFYNQHGEEYVKNQRDFYSDVSDTGRDFLRESLEANIENRIIADIGCGAGDDLLLYQKMGAKKVIGIEPSLKMLDQKKFDNKLEDGVEILAGEFENIPLASESVDFVTARFSFHHVENLKEAFEEVARILKSDGLFLIVTRNPEFDTKIAKDQNLKKGEKIKDSIFDGRFVVESIPHKPEDYLSETCLKYFEVEENKPYSMNEDGEKMDGLLLKLRRK
jgi:ubiquinone/menaquinone biosynthesis C-methylase UbiE